MEITFKLNDAEFATLKELLSSAVGGPVSGAPLAGAPTTPGAGVDALAVGIEDAARMIGCAQGTVRKFIRQRRLPRMSGFRHILIPKAALEKFIKESTK